MKIRESLMAIKKAAQQVAALDAAGWGLVILRADRDSDIRRVIANYPHKRCQTEYKTKGVSYYTPEDAQCDNIMEAIGGNLTKTFFSRLQYPTDINDSARNPLREWLESSLIRKIGCRHRLMFIPNGDDIIGKAHAGHEDSQSWRTPEQMQNIFLIRAICEEKRKGGNHSLIVIGSRSGNICDELAEYAYVVDVGCPDEKEIAEIIWNACDECGGKYHGLESASANELAAISRGMREDDIRAVVNLAFALHEKPLANNAKDLFNAALDAKKQRIAGVRGLRWIDSSGFSEIGGMDEAKDWLTMRSAAFNYTFAAQKFEVAPPKGVLLAGLPGCGKTLFAKLASNLLSSGKNNRTPVLQMDLSAMLGRYLGEAETNFANALRMIENVAPCIVIVDEIEKFFGGISDGGHEASKHIFASLLEWMQAERNKPVLVIATANKVDKLPPELKRKGRFDETFFVGIPTYNDCKTIFKIHMMNKKNVLQQSFDHKKVMDAFFMEASRKLRFFNGADIEAIINSVFCVLFAGNAKKSPKTIDDIQRGGDIQDEYKYSTEEVEMTLLKELDRTRSYFDNNMDETASYWMLMKHLNFRNAGESDLYKDFYFDEDSGKFSFDGTKDCIADDKEYLDFLKEELKKIEVNTSSIKYDDAFRYQLALSIFKCVQSQKVKAQEK